MNRESRTVEAVCPLEVGICCANLDRLVEFYVALLGCRVVSVLEVPADNAQAACLSSCAYRVARVQLTSGERLKFLQPALEPREETSSWWILDRQGTSYLTFIVEDLAAAIERLQALNATILTGHQAVVLRSGVRLCFARDVEGNLIEFVEYEDPGSYRMLS